MKNIYERMINNILEFIVDCRLTGIFYEKFQAIFYQILLVVLQYLVLPSF